MNLIFISGIVLSALIGISLGLLGGGGSILTVPILVYVLGVDTHEAVGMSLAVVGATSLIGTCLHYKQGTVRLKTGLVFGVAGVMGAFAGAPLTALLSPPALMFTFALLMLVISLLMLRRKRDKIETNSNGEAVAFPSGNLVFWKAFSSGLVVGLLTGFLGVGGGFLIVPALVVFGGLGMKEAIGTSLFVIFLNCVAGIIGHVSRGGFNWNLMLIITLSAVSGAVLGTMLSYRIAANKLQKGFAVFVFGIGVFVLAKNYGVLFGG
ncbi:MAG TPA: sulfite exporter TauE/SafE family protein [Pyrinomonadaceae bacterium]|nr:sulfite exporter TauE/SafE family protein [Pyrinomonadaceae bacterium]